MYQQFSTMVIFINSLEIKCPRFSFSRSENIKKIYKCNIIIIVKFFMTLLVGLYESTRNVYLCIVIQYEYVHSCIYPISLTHWLFGGLLAWSGCCFGLRLTLLLTFYFFSQISYHLLSSFRREHQLAHCLSWLLDSCNNTGVCLDTLLVIPFVTFMGRR